MSNRRVMSVSFAKTSRAVIAVGIMFCFAAPLHASEPLDVAEVQKLLDKYKVPGVSIAVIKDFKISWAKGYGVADKESGTPVTTETMFQAASISKPVAAMASVKAVEKGLFGLDQDVNTILKTWKLPMDGFSKAVTPRMLMSHTSGMGDGFGFPGYGVAVGLPNYVQMMDGLPPSNRRKIRLEREPMTASEYSGGAVLMQELALTDAVGKPFPEIMQEWVLGPLGMTNSTFAQPLPLGREAQAARAHDRNGKRSADPWHVYPEHAPAGLWTTPTDLAKFLLEVQHTLHGQGGKVIKRESLLEMVSPVGVGDFAVGFGVRRAGQGWYFGHGGSNWGFQSNMIAHFSKGYGVAVMTNGDSGGRLIQDLLNKIQKADSWDMNDQPPPRGYGPESVATSQSTIAKNQPSASVAGTQRTSPSPESEPMLRRRIAALQKGEPDSQATPEPQDKFAETSRAIQALGALKSVTFKEINQQGWDVFIVEFATSRWEWAMAPLSPDGKVIGSLRRKIP
ncbi:MAG TPA: serine hydrolase domain-containing protein [Steroidobacteraceae bacterium]|nr:serine hydrolase domain-containing protein [Steroidobacteraceae bacterium]